MKGQSTSFLQHPSLHYCLLMVLGFFSVYISMPIVLYPQSTVEWIDLVINLTIFIPSSLLVAISGLFAIICAVFSNQIDEKSWLTKFAGMLLKAFGIRNLLLSEFVHLGPVDILVRILGSLFRRQE